MNAEERFEALAASDSDALQTLADRILARGCAVHVAAGPEVVSTAVRVPVAGTVATSAVLGHVVLTTCTVLLDGVRGDGARSGRALAEGVAAAVCDAEAERDGALAAEVAELCRRTRSDADRRRRARASLVAATRVEDPR